MKRKKLCFSKNKLYFLLLEAISIAVKKFNVPNSGSTFVGGGGICFGGITDGAFGMATGMAAFRGACGAGFFRGLFC